MQTVEETEIAERSVTPKNLKAVNSTKTPPAKRKSLKKKNKYSNLIANMMRTHKQDQSKKIEKEREALRRVVGGGAFSKVDKI
eukprot:9018647-Ditylum_brightwellii.AAC.1